MKRGAALRTLPASAMQLTLLRPYDKERHFQGLEPTFQEVHYKEGGI